MISRVVWRDRASGEQQQSFAIKAFTLEAKTMKTEKVMKKLILASALFGVAAVTMASSLTANAATPEERAKCEEMFKKMGSTAPHDHGADKTGAPGPMTAEHVRCKEILGSTGQAGSSDHGGKSEKK